MNPPEAIAAPGLPELEELIAARWTPEAFRRFQCVWLTHALDLPVQEIAKALGLNISTVRRIRTEFARNGAKAIDGKGNRGGRRNECMSLEDKVAFLGRHADLFDRLGAVDISALKAAFEAHVGRSVHKTTVYRLLERHGRKKPRRRPGTSRR